MEAVILHNVRLSFKNFALMSSSLLFQSTRYVMLKEGKSHIPFVSEQAHKMYCSIMVKSSMPAHNETLHSNKSIIFMEHSLMLKALIYKGMLDILNLALFLEKVYIQVSLNLDTKVIIKSGTS